MFSTKQASRPSSGCHRASLTGPKPERGVRGVSAVVQGSRVGRQGGPGRGSAAGLLATRPPASFARVLLEGKSNQPSAELTVRCESYPRT